MLYTRFPSSGPLRNFVECYWTIESDDADIVEEKIIPDGFPELIFHFKDAYEININGRWELQTNALLAGQAKKYFFLKNTGKSAVFVIKLKPTALTHLFNVAMNVYSDKVVPLNEVNIQALKVLTKKIIVCNNHSDKIAVVEKELEPLIGNLETDKTSIDKIVDFVFRTNGSASLTEMQQKLFVTERQVQRMFQKYIGLSPKLYCRIIRFNYIFKLAKEEKFSLTDLTHKAGYFDQSHFIRDFKNFTGEDPSKYCFSEHNLANFFLKK